MIKRAFSRRWRSMSLTQVLVLCVAAIAAVTPASAAWTAPATLSPASPNNSESQIGVDAAGNAVAVWSHYDGNFSYTLGSQYDAGSSSWGTASEVSTTTSNSPRVSVNASGDALGTENYSVGVEANGYSAASGSWGQAVLLARNEMAPEAGLDNSGNGTLIDVSGSGILQGRHYSASSMAWGSPQAISSTTVNESNGAADSLATSGAGQAVAAWIQGSGSSSTVQAKIYDPVTDRWLFPGTLATGTVYRPTTAIDSNGNALVAWTTNLPSGFEIDSASFTASSGTWSPVTTIANDSAPVLGSQAVAMNAHGDSAIAWLQSDGTNVVVMARRRASGGSWTTASTLSSDGIDASSPSVAIDSASNILVGWVRSNVQIATYNSVSGAWSPTQTLSGANADTADVAMGPNGQAGAIWTLNNGAGPVTQSSINEAPIAGPASSVSVRVSPASIVANGTSTSTATATVSDVNGHNVAGDSVAFASTDGGETIGSVTDHGNGTYTATVTSSTTVGAPTLTASDSSLLPHVTGTVTLTQTPGPATNVSVGFSPASIVANGTSTSTATATVTDVNGNRVPGESVGFSSSDSGETIGSVTGHGDGTYTATVTSSTTVGAPTLTASDSSVLPHVTGQATLTQTVPVPSIAAPPSVSGDAASGQTMSESHGSWTNGPTSYAYQWQDCDGAGNSCSAIAGATSQTYTLAAGDVGHTIRVQESASNTGGTSSPAESAATGVVQPVSAPPSKPSNSAAPAISGTARAGLTLTSSLGTWSGTPPISYTYQWQLCRPGCSNIAGATASALKLTAADLGARVRVVVTASNTAGSGRAISSQVGPVAAAGPTTGQVKAALVKGLAASGPGAKIPQLLKHAGYVVSFTTPSAGHLVISWYFVPKGARLAKARKPTLVATASVIFHKQGKTKVKITLTGEGRKLLKGAKHVKLTAKGSFTPAGGTTTITTQTINLKC
jgi:adhesin/invasin